MKNKFIWDIEVFKNYFLLCALNVKTSEFIHFEISQFNDDWVNCLIYKIHLH